MRKIFSVQIGYIWWKKNSFNFSVKFTIHNFFSLDSVHLSLFDSGICAKILESNDYFCSVKWILTKEKRKIEKMLRQDGIIKKKERINPLDGRCWKKEVGEAEQASESTALKVARTEYPLIRGIKRWKSIHLLQQVSLESWWSFSELCYFDREWSILYFHRVYSIKTPKSQFIFSKF